MTNQGVRNFWQFAQQLDERLGPHPSSEGVFPDANGTAIQEGDVLLSKLENGYTVTVERIETDRVYARTTKGYPGLLLHSGDWVVQPRTEKTE